MAYYFEICLDKLVSVQVSLLKVLCKFSKFYPFKLVLWVKATSASVALLQMLPFMKNLPEPDCHVSKCASSVSLWVKSLLPCAPLFKFIQDFETGRCCERNSFSEWGCAVPFESKSSCWKSYHSIVYLFHQICSTDQFSVISLCSFWYLPQGSQGQFVKCNSKCCYN